MTTRVVQPTKEREHAWPPTQGDWTYEDWYRLPDDGMRYELIDGVLYMSPPPSVAHQSAVLRLAARMLFHADTNGLGLVLTSPIAVRLPGRDSVVEPDILFIAKERLDIVGEETIDGAPDLVVEVLSPGNYFYDRGKKQEAYRVAGVREYWIVDNRMRTVEVLQLQGEVFVPSEPAGRGAAVRSSALAGFEIHVDDLFG
ncbi:MAG: Uma2 family endonuclease [Chloroflexi bacterium]|nr:Uma2 family endonuclease [Chloroflexota bacterium]MCI0580619.1 Uma2 family endonuclease [Chloroflexota bacterium]MCI0649717.1 Uma2 family endonuclease [Chloroflexota bacterium]MCI0727765.1 Uma2 family endonuclease [Chloroflexota bacterium]